MQRNIVLFFVTFMAGALIAFAARAAMHKPHLAVTAHQHTTPEYAPMVGNALTPATSTPAAGAPASESNHAAHDIAPAKVPAAAAAHSGHHADATETPAATKAVSETVNTRCAICGMPVDPTLPTIEYQGKKIGFGCKMCPPKFKADPDKYGPIYLRNEVIKR